MKTRASERPQCPRTRPDRGETPTSEKMHTINQQPSTIRGEAQPIDDISSAEYQAIHYHQHYPAVTAGLKQASLR